MLMHRKTCLISILTCKPLYIEGKTGQFLDVVLTLMRPKNTGGGGGVGNGYVAETKQNCTQWLRNYQSLNSSTHAPYTRLLVLILETKFYDRSINIKFRIKGSLAICVKSIVIFSHSTTVNAEFFQFL